MIRLPCPYCGLRDASEFGYVDEQQRRPSPGRAGIAGWRSYLYLRRNPAGWNHELWLHRSGCGRYLTVERHTVTNEVRAVGPPRPGGGA